MTTERLPIEQANLLTPTSAERRAAIGLVLMHWPELESDRTFYSVYILKNEERAFDVCTRLTEEHRKNPAYAGVYFQHGNRVIGAFPLPGGLTEEQEAKLVAAITKDYSFFSSREGLKTPVQ